MSFGVTNSSPLSLATCLDPMLGSQTVFVNDGGVCKVGISMTTTGGLIIGPGSVLVFCEDFPVSVQGDAITAHPPCPLPATHCVAFTGGSSDVFTGGIFPPAGAPGSGGSSGGGTQPEIAELQIDLFRVRIPPLGSIPTLGVGWPGPIVFDYKISNSGTAPTGPFVAALYEVLGFPPLPPPPPTLPLGITITRDTPETFPNIVFIEEKNIASIPAGGGVASTWSLPVGNPFAILPSTYVRYYVLAVDIDLQVFEQLEVNNSSPVTTVVTTS